MKQLKLWMLAAILIICGSTTFTSCSNDDTPINPDEPEVSKARVISTVHDDEAKMTVYSILYPSTDPFGNEETLSGTITVGDEVTKDAPAKGLMLYNHFTIFRADQCPSKGSLAVEKIVAGSGLITISPDYYGFGITEDKMQAYCISNVNAQASVDALLAAKELLPTLGYKWNDDILFNMGYSQGGQTSIGVARLIAENYPDLHITYTIAGGGSYDIPETYRQFISSNETGMPSSVISVLLSYNEYFKLGYKRSDMFLEPVLSNIDKWFLSKNYTSDEIDAMVSSNVSDFATPALLDMESDISKSFFTALDKDNLCKGWTPRTDDKYVLVAHTKDTTVPVANTINLYNFLKSKGVENIEPYVGNYGTLPGKSAHESAALIFAMAAINKVCTTLGIDVWFDLSELNF